MAVEQPFSPPTMFTGLSCKAMVVRHISKVMHAKYHLSNALMRDIPLILCIMSALAVFGKNIITNLAHISMLVDHGAAILFANYHAMAYTSIGLKHCSISADNWPSGPAALSFKSLALVFNTSCTVSAGRFYCSS